MQTLKLKYDDNTVIEVAYDDEKMCGETATEPLYEGVGLLINVKKLPKEQWEITYNPTLILEDGSPFPIMEKVFHGFDGLDFDVVHDFELRDWLMETHRHITWFTLRKLQSISHQHDMVRLVLKALLKHIGE